MINCKITTCTCNSPIPERNTLQSATIQSLSPFDGHHTFCEGPVSHVFLLLLRDLFQTRRAIFILFRRSFQQKNPFTISFCNSPPFYHSSIHSSPQFDSKLSLLPRITAHNSIFTDKTHETDKTKKTQTKTKQFLFGFNTQTNHKAHKPTRSTLNNLHLSYIIPVEIHTRIDLVSTTHSSLLTSCVLKSQIDSKTSPRCGLLPRCV